VADVADVVAPCGYASVVRVPLLCYNKN